MSKKGGSFSHAHLWMRSALVAMSVSMEGAAIHAQAPYQPVDISPIKGET
jgi:hypothetical protein